MARRVYYLSANLLALIHFCWTCLLIGGALGMLFYPAYAPIQIIIMSFTLLIAIPFGKTCPLTLFEEKLRQKIDRSYRNGGSFIATYINKLLKTDIEPRRVHTTTAGLYVLAYSIAISLLILGR